MKARTWKKQWNRALRAERRAHVWARGWHKRWSYVGQLHAQGLDSEMQLIDLQVGSSFSIRL